VLELLELQTFFTLVLYMPDVDGELIERGLTLYRRRKVTCHELPYALFAPDLGAASLIILIWRWLGRISVSGCGYLSQY